MTDNPHLDVVNAFVTGLVESGVRHVVISPGSRSTPLTMTFARTPSIRVWTILDERSAGFFAFGLARASRTPVALVCTSGTATANYHPAIMEALNSEVPLIVVTADRPPELYGVGSNQTVDQMKLYGTDVKAFYQMPVPDGYRVLGAHARTTAQRAVFKATSEPSGPVHINWPFREPLVPPNAQHVIGHDTDAALPSGGSRCVHRGRMVPDDESIACITALLKSSRRGLIICGPQDAEGFAQAVAGFAGRAQLPILADPLSQVRSAFNHNALVIDSYDLLLRDSHWFDELQPDFILRFGRTVTSKALGQFLQHHQGVTQVIVTEGDNWHDPFFAASRVIQSDPTTLCALLAEKAQDHAREYARTEWEQTWSALQDRIHKTVSGYIADLQSDDLSFEGRIVTELQRIVTDGSIVLVGNSMPIRDVDSFWVHQDREIRLLSNRGVSGIDGVVSTAMGTAAADVGRVTLVIGDISFYHDLNALYIALENHLDVTVVLVNNQGGGIFAFLPQAAYPDTLDKFQTPHNLSFQPVVEMFGGEYHLVSNWGQFGDVLREGFERRGLHVVEVPTQTEGNVGHHRKLFEYVRENLRQG